MDHILESMIGRKKNNTLNFEQHSIMQYSKIYEEKSITSTSYQIHVLIAITAYNTKNVEKYRDLMKNISVTICGKNHKGDTRIS